MCPSFPIALHWTFGQQKSTRVWSKHFVWETRRCCFGNCVSETFYLSECGLSSSKHNFISSFKVHNSNLTLEYKFLNIRKLFDFMLLSKYVKSDHKIQINWSIQIAVGYEDSALSGCTRINKMGWQTVLIIIN